jgi:Putative Ig domain
MSKLSWLTPVGTVAYAETNLPVTAEIIAVDSDNPSSLFTYLIISGSLPPGLSLSSTGVISGIAANPESTNNTSNTLYYDFVVRAQSQVDGTVLDGNFDILLSYISNTDLTWVTPAGSLGTVPNGEFYQLPLSVQSTVANAAVTFSRISGELPPGMQVVSRGYLQGVPTLLTAVAVDSAQSFSFTIRASSSTGTVQDRSFTLTVTNVYGPIIQPLVTYLGSFFDGSYYSQQLSVLELNPNVKVTWSNIGPLPPNLTLDQNGLISGFIIPVVLQNTSAPPGYDGDYVVQNVITQQQEFDQSPYDFQTIGTTYNFKFTIQAYDGANYDLQDYVMNIINRADYTADNSNVTVDNTYLTVDTLNSYNPVLLNGNVTVLPTGRAGGYYAYQFLGYDFQGDPITFSLVNSVGTFDAQVAGTDDGFDYGSLDTGSPGDDHTHGVPFDSFNISGSPTENLPGLNLDASTGWLYGKLNAQTISTETYTFGIRLSKVHNSVTYYSNPYYFQLPVLGNANNTITWITSQDLGTVDNGSVSDLAIEATSNSGLPVIYRLVDQPGVSARLPQGLSLLSTGELSGRVSFEVFGVDKFTTTFDGDSTTIDRVFNFTVQAETNDGVYYPDGTVQTPPTAADRRQFTIKVKVVDSQPYDNLYLQAMPSIAQQQLLAQTLTNTAIFDANIIYRPNDPWFGVNDRIEMLFLPGITVSDLNSYANAIVHNHWSKRYDFGTIDSAVVLDDNYKVKYEVVYINIIDPGEVNNELGPGLVLDLTGNIANGYIDSKGNSNKVVYPNSSLNMNQRVVDALGYADQSSLPAWMTSNQLGNTTGSFMTPLGFKLAAVLAYAKPGYGQSIVYRLNDAGINFKNIEFSVDRYFLDNYYSTNWNIPTQSYYTSTETTFDALPHQNIGTIVAGVNYAVSVPFDQINGRSVDYISAAGGIDGVYNFNNGDTLVFAIQENFGLGEPYDGWIEYYDLFIGDNVTTGQSEGYGSEGFDLYKVVPGYLEKVAGASTVNQRGGVWQVQIVNRIITLNFIQEISPNDRIRVYSGHTYGGSIMYYKNILSAGRSVPYYAVYYAATPATVKRTTFNNNTTRFLSYRDQYYMPGTQDKYVKFPQLGTFE